MNFAVVTYDMVPEKQHLMPWRTICEVVKHAPGFAHNGIIFNLSNDASLGGRAKEYSCPTVMVRKERAGLVARLKDLIAAYEVDVLYWPVAWREPGWRIDVLGQLGIKVVAYFPGGVYHLAAALYAARKLGLKQALPYVREAVASKVGFLKRLADNGVSDIITLSAYTKKVVQSNGWSEAGVHYVSLAKDESAVSEKCGAAPEQFEEWLGGDPYYLFMGPPSGIRGIFELLAAFERAAEKNSQIRLVCLFRSDARLDEDRIAQKIGASKFSDRIYSVWKSVDRTTLNFYMSKSHAIVMPFVLVPSEIPLAIIEAMVFGKPIISTGPGGTGAFVSDFGAAPKVGDVKGLANVLLSYAENGAHYQDMCSSARSAYDALHGWREMTQNWIEIGSVNTEEGSLS